MSSTQTYVFSDLSGSLAEVWPAWEANVLLLKLLLAGEKKDWSPWARATKDIPLSDFKLHRASQGTAVRSWPVSGVEDLGSTVGTNSNEFMTSRV